MLIVLILFTVGVLGFLICGFNAGKWLSRQHRANNKMKEDLARGFGGLSAANNRNDAEHAMDMVWMWLIPVMIIAFVWLNGLALAARIIGGK